MIAPIFRESYVAICIIIQHTTTGFSLGLPTIIAKSLTSNVTDSNDIFLSNEEMSWITATYSVTGPIGYLFMPTLMQIYGRRFFFVINNTLMLMGAIVIATAPNLEALIAGRAIQGIVFCKITLCFIIMAEYCHPRRRGTFLLINIATLYTTVLVCHGLSAIMSWRQLAWLACVPSIFGIITPLTWPDTPYWLAYKNRYDDCRNSFKWLRGNNLESKEELREIIFAQQELAKQNVLRNGSKISWIIKAFQSKDFLKPMGITVLSIIIIHSCGAYYLFAYVIQIMKEITDNDSQAYYFTLGLDLSKVLAVCCAILLEKKIKRKILLKYCSFIAFMLLGLMCVLDYLNKIGVINILWLPAVILMLYCFTISAGLIPLLVVFKGEIIPLKYKGIAVSATGVINTLFGFIGLKLTANMLTILKTYGTFAVNLFISLCAMTLLLLFMPETKDRTLQNIENEITGLKIINDDKNNQQISEDATSKLMK